MSSSLHFTVPYLKRHNGNGNGKTSAGQLSPEDWEGRMRKMHEKSEESIMHDMRALMEQRTLTLVEKVTQPIVAEIRKMGEEMSTEIRGMRGDMSRRAEKI